MDGRQGTGERTGVGESPGPVFDAIREPAVAYEGVTRPTVVAVNGAYWKSFGDSDLSPGNGLAAALDPGHSLEDECEALEAAVRAGEATAVGLLRTESGEGPAYRIRHLPLDNAAEADGVVRFVPVEGAAGDEELRTFARVVSHDLRNPLEVARIRLDAAEDSGEAEHFEKVRWAHDRIRQLSRDVLFLTDAADAVDPEPVALERVVGAAWESVEAPDAALEAHALPTVTADEDALRRLLSNLFRNAVDHAGPGVTVRVSARPDGFVVADDGPGFSADLDDRIFEPGVSGADGTGLGLAVVARVASAHGWRVEASTAPEGGAAVSVADVSVLESGNGDGNRDGAEDS